MDQTWFIYSCNQLEFQMSVKLYQYIKEKDYKIVY